VSLLSELEPVNAPCPAHDIEIDADKLSKEAFRLQRTLQNFLNTNEPILSLTNSSDSEANSSRTSAPRSSLEQQRSEFLFGFDRESHSSLRSTDESSVHSSSNSHKEDEDPTSTIVLPNVVNGSSSNKKIIPPKSFPKSKRFSTCHQTEDESGFSSMNSFHEIGLPLHSTLISHANTSSSSSASSTEDSQSETIKMKTLANEIGVPILEPKIDVQPRRFNSSTPSSFQNSKLKLLESNEATARVLWV